MGSSEDFYNDLNLQGSALRSAALDPLAAAPGTPVVGQAYFDTVLGCFRLWNGSTWLGVCGNESIKITNTDVTTDIDSAVAQNFSELFGAVQWNDNTSRYTPNLGTGQITINLAGRYRFRFYSAWVKASGNSARATLRVSVNLGTATVSPLFQDNYIRDASGALEAGQGGEFTFEATAGQVLTVVRQRVSGSDGVITLQSLNNYVELEHLR